MEARGTGRLLRFLGGLAGVALGCVFLVAALIKSADPGLFADQITAYKILPRSLSAAAAHGVILCELFLGALLLLRLVPRVVLLFAMALLLLFLGATAWAWSHGNAESCGCFGRAAGRGPLAVIIEDLIYLAVALFSFALSRWKTPARKRWIGGAVAVPFLLAAPWIGPVAPVDAWVTPVRPGADLSTLAADGLRVPLGEGTVFLALLGKDCAACDAAVPGMSDLAASADGPKVAAVFAGGNREMRAWRLQHVPAFPVGYAPAKVLRQYYRSLPVFILLEEGRIRKAWWGDWPGAEAVLSEMRKP